MSPSLRNQDAGATIFAVDDEPDHRDLLQRLLSTPGLEYPCRCFGTGEDLIDALLQVLRGAPPPLICFVDVKMTGMDGFDVLRWIRCQHTLDPIPVVMLSSADDPARLSEAREVGAQCYLAKFPTATQMHAVILEAQRYGGGRMRGAHFELPCNLLLTVPVDASAAPPPRQSSALSF